MERSAFDPDLARAAERARRLLEEHIATLEIFSFCKPGEGKRFAHHDSDRKPAAVYRDAELAPNFCSLRTPENAGGKKGNLTLEGVALIGETILDAMLADDLNPRVIAGIPNAGDPIVTAVIAAGARRGLVIEQVVLKKLDGPNGREFHRADPTDRRPVDALVDDLTSLSDVKARAARAVRLEGDTQVTPPIYIALDRREGGVEILANLGVRVRAVLTIDQVLETLAAKNLIDAATRQRSEEYAARRRAIVAANMGPITNDLRANP